MLNVILLVDNYNEMSYLQTTLRNLGFDVIGIQRETKLEETLLTFRADVIMVTGASKQINGVRVAVGLHKLKVAPKVVLLFSSAHAPKLEGPMAELVSAILLTPVKTSDLLAVLAQVGGLDIQTLVEKHNRLNRARQASLSDEEKVNIIKSRPEGAVEPGASGKSESPEQELEYFSKEELDKRFDEALGQMPVPEVDGIPHDEMVKRQKELKATLDPASNRPLEEERRDFVKALFLKGSSQNDT